MLEDKNCKCRIKPSSCWVWFVRLLWVQIVAKHLNRTTQDFIRFWFCMLAKCDWGTDVCETRSLFLNAGPVRLTVKDNNADKWKNSLLELPHVHNRQKRDLRRRSQHLAESVITKPGEVSVRYHWPLWHHNGWPPVFLKIKLSKRSRWEFMGIHQHDVDILLL